MTADVAAWLARAVADARARDLPQLEPLLTSLAASLQTLRDADAEFGHPALEVVPSESGEPADDA
ncbi:MAG TPA: hypothetical protein VFK57_19725 [Vicinamibacterales bacterium]|nr:hypothetical protein [Vicinamibacterales bacterium]